MVPVCRLHQHDPGSNRSVANHYGSTGTYHAQIPGEDSIHPRCPLTIEDLPLAADDGLNKHTVEDAQEQ